MYSFLITGRNCLNWMKFSYGSILSPCYFSFLCQLCFPIETLRQNGRILQTTFSNAFSWMKMYGFRSRFHCSLFLRFELTIFQHWFRSWIGAGQATSHYLSQWWPSLLAHICVTRLQWVKWYKGYVSCEHSTIYIVHTLCYFQDTHVNTKWFLFSGTPRMTRDLQVTMTPYWHDTTLYDLKLSHTCDQGQGSNHSITHHRGMA